MTEQQFTKLLNKVESLTKEIRASNTIEAYKLLSRLHDKEEEMDIVKSRLNSYLKGM